MDQGVLFCLLFLTMLIAWFGHRQIALVFFGVTVVLMAADYLHHATDVLPLSF